MTASVLLRTRILLAILFLATVGVHGNPASAQSSDTSNSYDTESNGFIIHQNVRRVVVDVVVSDSNGRPVSGLVANDFSIAEDGTPQHIHSFDIHDFDSISDSLPRPANSLPTNTFLNADNYRPAISIPRVLMNIAKFLADLPGHKNVIWVSASFPSTIMPTGDPSSEGLSMNDEIKEATDALARGQIAVYPVDVRSVVATGPSASDVGEPTQASSANSADYELNARHMTEQEIADATGGRAFYGTTDVAAALTEATEVGGHYYTLSYSPSNQNYNGRLRRIHVDLSKRGYHLSYRRSYYGNPTHSSATAAGSEPQPELRSAAELEPFQLSRPADSLSPNMQHGAPLAHQLLFRAHIHALTPPAKATPKQMASLADQPAYFRERRPNRTDKPLRPIQLQTYEIDYTVAARYPSLELAAAAFDAEGKLLNGLVQRAAQENEDVLAEPRHEAIYRVQTQFDVPTTAVSVRLAVRDVATDNVGALEINLPLAPEGKTTGGSLHTVLPSSEGADPAKPR